MSLYGIEINEPHQVVQGTKFRTNVKLTIAERELKAPDGQSLIYTEHSLSFTEKPDKFFVTADKESAEALAATYADSWDAAVVPLNEGVEFTAEQLVSVIKQEQQKAKERQRAARALAR